MKVGDRYDVTIAGQVVTQAELREMGDGTATLVVPGTVVVMATRTEITDTPQRVDGSGTQVIIEDVERQSAAVADAPVASQNPTVETPKHDENAQSVQEATTPVVTENASTEVDGTKPPVSSESNE